MLNDYGKLWLLLTAMIGGFAIIVAGIITGDSTAQLTGVGIVGPVVGYLTGNGVLARTGQAPSPVVVPSDPKVRRRLAEVVSAELDAEQAEADRLAAEEGLT